MKRSHRRLAPVEAENKLVQIALEILWLNTVMRAIEPRLEVAEDPVDMWRNFVRSLRCPNNAHAMLVPHQRRVGIPAPAIGSKCGAGLNIFHQKITNADLARILQDRETPPTCPFTPFPLPVFVGEHLNGAVNQIAQR